MRHKVGVPIFQGLVNIAQRFPFIPDLDPPPSLHKSPKL